MVKISKELFSKGTFEPIRRSKYNNKKTFYNGVEYDSKREAEFAMQLDLLAKASDLSQRVVRVERQVPFQVVVNDKKICKYVADFEVDYADGHSEVIDVKGFKTDVYRLKKKLVEAQFGVKIREV